MSNKEKSFMEDRLAKLKTRKKEWPNMTLSMIAESESLDRASVWRYAKNHRISYKTGRTGRPLKMVEAIPRIMKEWAGRTIRDIAEAENLSVSCVNYFSCKYQIPVLRLKVGRPRKKDLNTPERPVGRPRKNEQK